MSNGPNNSTGPSSRMLIDAAHPEETRVVVLKGNRVEEFDFESASKKQLRGNIYLAKVTRVEPSLQAAFVEYGGNRHGFLAFSEIHPDYYQIPFADRQALLEEEARAHRDEDDEPRESRGERGGERGGRRGGEGRSNGGGRGEPREARSDREGGEGRSERSDRSERNARGEGRGNRDGREGRDGRGDRGQRRSRRHRRDSAPATALDRRDAVDESISGPAFEAEDGLIAAEAPALALAIETPLDGVAETAEVVEAASRDTADSIEAVAPDARAEAADALEPTEAESPAETAGVEVPEVSAVAVSAVDVPNADVTAERPHEAAAEAAADAVPASVEAVSDVVHAEATEAGATEAGATEAGATEAGATEADVTAAAVESYVVETHADDAHHGDGSLHTGADEPAPSDAEPEVRDEAGAFETTAAEPAIAELSVVEHAAEADAVEPEEEHVEQIGGDALSDVAPRPVRLRRHYKIQEVIKRRQILLIQVVKEERGNKGAALTTYLSLAGRYSVLMPNTAKGGGISRKITDGEDRKRLKAIAGELDVPEGMGVILRTAGASRTPIEVKRDFEYLLRMWESVRELTLKSAAPTLVYEEGSLIKRSIRDLYSKDVEEVVVSGEDGFAEARDFMRMLMPGNAKSVVEYRDPSPIFAKSGVEAQLDAMFSSHVTLKSGGYLVINQTEALVAIDVNSGRSTREHNIEDTALRTNMEAADEVARQLRLRDLAGLIVVDFIDMEEGRNNRSVERRIKEALKNDRARIQIGRISHFGLLEMSRQRIRTGVLEGSTVVCPHCAGTGTVRSTSSIALHVLRLIEDALIKDAAYDLVVRSRGEVALYMLNQKRAKLVELEQRFGVTISVEGDASLTGTAYHAIERGDPATPAEAPAPRQGLVRVDSIAPVFDPQPEFEEAEAAESDGEGQTPGASDDAEDAGEAAAESGEGGERRRKRRRRRRGRERDGAGSAPGEAHHLPEGEADGAEGFESVASSEALAADAVPERMQVIGFSSEPSGADEVGTDAVRADDAVPAGRADIDAAEAVDASFASEARSVDDAPAAEPAAAAETAEGSDGVEAVEPAQAADAADPAPKRRRSRRTAARATDEAPATAEAEPAADEAPKRRRRPARARAAEVETGDVAEGAGATDSAEVDAAPTTPAATADAPATIAEPAGVAEPLGAPPAADRDVGADTVERHGEPTGAATTVTAPEPAVEAPPQPDRPKRSGWWQRAKAPSAS